jgi:hypothetical protein
MRRALIAMAVAALAILGCGGEDDGDQQACADAFAEGVTTADAIVASEEGCIDENGDVALIELAGDECADGRILHWNDEGWGYHDGEWHRHDRPDGQLVPPDAELASCEG